MAVTGFITDDGGRAAAGFTGTAGDCFARAYAIATSGDYREVYDEVAAANAATGRARSAREGIATKTMRTFMADRGWTWTPTMRIGSGCTVHLDANELPSGILIARLSGHVCAVIDGIVFDTYDPRRDGTRCVYGVWAPQGKELGWPR